jgi:S-adenosylmethionine hydrolase
MEMEIGQNIKAEIKGSVLTLTVDMSKTFGPSKSGKTTIIASSQGNVPIQGSNPQAHIGLNIYRK